jgi:predicted permease
LTAVLSLGICIGANTAVFTIANRLLFREAEGVADPARLVDLAPVRSDGRFAEPVIPYRMYTELREHATTIEDLFGYQLDVSAMSLRGADGAERVFSTYVTANYFTALGIRPAVGRLFTAAESEVPGGTPVVVLSHGFWKRRFNGDPAIPGRTLHINGEPLTIVGVAPEGFHGLSVVVADIWLPVSVAFGKGTDPNGVRLAVGGRLREGVTIKQAASEIDGIGRALDQSMPAAREAVGGLREDGGGSLRVLAASPLPAIVRVPVYAFLGVLVGLTGLVLLIACTNIAGVLLARATTRQREIAVRLAMGAGRARLVRQLLTETLLLFLAGGAAGLALARIMTSLVVLALPALPVPVDTSLPLDGRVIAFTALVALAAAVASGLLPSLQASKGDVVTTLKIGSPTATDRLRLRSAFAVAQVAFSMLLVVGAGLLGRAMQRSGSVDLGFDRAAIEVATLDLSLGGYTERSGPPFIGELLDVLQARADVSHASVAATLPLGGLRRMCCGVDVPGVLAPDGRPFEPAMNVVAPGYFETLRIRLVDGRDFTKADRAGSEAVAIVSEAAARAFWPGRRAVGQHVVWQKMPSLFARQPGAAMTPPRPTPVPLTVVGVAADIKAGGRAPSPLMYLPFAQHYEPDIALMARSSSGRRLTAEIREAVAAANPNLPIIAAFRLADQTSPVLMQLRVTAAVSATIGLVAIFLAAIGIYGLMAYTVTRRTREIGIRLAMGARRADVVRLVLGQGMLLVLSGSAAGLLLAAGASGLLARLLFGVPPRDPVTFAGAMLLFVAIGIVACYVPVRRATRINAMDALRYE